MTVDLSLDLFGMRFKNPVWTASGTFGFGIEYASFVDLNAIGAVCVKGISLHPRDGNLPPRIWETPCGMLNSIGLQNPGVHAFVNDILPGLSGYECRIVVNVYGSTIDEYVEVVKVLSDFERVDVIELNVSCPNVSRGGMLFGVDPVECARLTESVKKVTAKPVVVKLTPNVTDVVEIAKSVELAGADGISAINTLTGMAIDVYSRKPRLGTLFGGLSGPAIKPVALRMVYQICGAVEVPVIGVGGISTWEDAVEFLLAGAVAVQVGTANFFNPGVTVDIINGMKNYMVKMGYKSVSEISGNLD